MLALLLVAHSGMRCICVAILLYNGYKRRAFVVLGVLFSSYPNNIAYLLLLNEDYMAHVDSIARELKIETKQVTAVAALLQEGATIPFIARYRKEHHGSLDEVAILSIRDRLEALAELDARKNAIVKSLTERDILTPELSAAIAGAETLTLLEDIYLPYRPKKRTRAMMAREKGLEPLAHLLLEQQPTVVPHQAAAAYINEELGVADRETALAGARDIIAEVMAEDANTRSAMRSFFEQKAFIQSKVCKGKEEEGAKYRDYFDWQEPVNKLAGHRLLAMLRGEREDILSVHFLPEQEEAVALLTARYIQGNTPSGQEVLAAIEDGYKRLLAPSMETELKTATKKKADIEAIHVFTQNLRQLLLASPLGQKRTLAIDPGFRTGCKVAVLDAQGTLLYHDVIYILSAANLAEAGKKITALCEKYSLEAIAIGNGTASRESEQLVRSLGLSVPCFVVSESGASVYSASEVARKEFPDLDLTVRGAISIGRRLMDPLAELVKIDPKAIGVGQYQHDVNQTDLKNSLKDVVVSCVNAVGVSLNTASGELLSYVSGLGASLASAVVAHREQHGPFAQRKDLLKVARLGPKAFEQAAGFLRIEGGKNPLDASAVHPESYGIVAAMAKDVGCTLQDLMSKPELRKQIVAEKYVTDSFGLPTIQDILQELEKPGRDPRSQFEMFAFSDKVTTMADLEVGMVLPGLVTNITNFGAFVDIGVHQDGLVHISQLADGFVSDPHAVVKVQQKVLVRVQEVDIARKRIALSMKTQPDAENSTASKPEQNKRVTEGQRPQANKGHNKPAHEKREAAAAKTSGKAEPFHNPFAALIKK